MPKALRQGLLVVSVIIAISIYVAYPSFKLALFGDDFQQIWNFQHMVGERNFVNYFTYFIGGYGAFEMTSAILYEMFGDNYKMYYIFSYVYKLIAAFAIWPLIYYLTRSKLTAFYASLFLSVTTIGLETTNWVVNSPAYIAIANLSLFFVLFIKSRENLKIKYFIGAILFFYLAHIFAPVRMTGLLAFTFFLEAFLYFKSSNFKKIFTLSELKLSFVRLLVIIIVFGVISKGPAGGRANTMIGEASAQLNAGVTKIFTMSQTRSDFLFYPIMTVGRLVIPNTIVPARKLTVYLSLFIFTGLLVLNIPKGKKIIIPIIVAVVVWTVISLFIQRVNQNTLVPQDSISLLIGGYTLIIGFILIIFSGKQKIATAFFLGVFWTLFSFIFPWIRSPETLNTTDQRYLIPSAIGITILFASTIGLGSKLGNRINLFLLVTPFLIINMVTTRTYFNYYVENEHGSEVLAKIWSGFPEIPQADNSKGRLLFYFDSVPEKNVLKHYGLTFGFPFRMAMKYNIDGWDKMPQVTDDWKGVVSAVTDGQFFAISGFPKEPTQLTNVYAFFLTADNRLINISDEVRTKLEAEEKLPPQN